MPRGWRIDPKNRYVCMCSTFRAYDLSECTTHESDEAPGYYKCGLRCTGDNIYECICGKEYIDTTNNVSTINQAFYHVCDQQEGLIECCMKKVRTFCQKCQVQLKSPSALKIHYNSKEHIDPDRVLIKDLKCELCDFEFRCEKRRTTHLASAKHLQRVQHGVISLHCNTCDIKCIAPKQMLTHLQTAKHKKLAKKH